MGTRDCRRGVGTGVEALAVKDTCSGFIFPCDRIAVHFVLTAHGFDGYCSQCWCSMHDFVIRKRRYYKGKKICLRTSADY